MIFFRFFRFIILFIFVFLISLVISIFYINKNYLTEENIRNYLTEIIHEKTGLNNTFVGSIEFRKPGNIVLNKVIIGEDKTRTNIVVADEIKINFNMARFVRNFDFKPDYIAVYNMDLNLNRKDGKWNLKLLDYHSDKNLEIPDIDIKKLKLNVKDFDSNYSYKADIHNLQLSRKLLSEEIDIVADFEYESTLFKKLKITSHFSFPSDFSHINIGWLKTEISNQKIELEGTIANLNDSKSQLIINTFNDINLKDFLKINKNIILNKFSATLNTVKVSDNLINLTSEIKNLNTQLSIDYNTKLNQVGKAEIKTKKTDIKKFKEFVSDFIKDCSGNSDLEIKVIKSEDKTHLYITAYSDNMSFKDIYELFQFKNAKMKLMITPSFNALNIIDTKAIFPYGTIKGNLRLDSDEKNENIYAKFSLDDIDVNLNMKIKNKFKNRKFYVDIKTSKFPFNIFYDIFNYVNNTLNSKPSKKDSVYNMKEREVRILWDSKKLADNPYISAKKLEILSDIKSFNSYELMEGNFKIKAYDGKMENIQKNMKESEKYALIFLPITTIFSLNRTGALKIDSELKTINISEIGVDFNLNNAKIVINKFYLDSKEFLVYAKGNMDTKNQKIDMEVYIINKKDYKSGALPEPLTDSKGRPAIAFKIKGSFKNNDLKIFDATNITELVEKQIKESIIIN